MITDLLVFHYEQVAGPVQYTFSLVPKDRRGELEQMMQDVIEGRRAPISDADFHESVEP